MYSRDKRFCNRRFDDSKIKLSERRRRKKKGKGNILRSSILLQFFFFQTPEDKQKV